jgi:positive regulator of sigma E activity
MADELEPTTQPGIATLLTQLGSDATDFARAEVRYLQAQAGERVAIALPALYMIAASAVLALSVAVALVVGMILLLIPLVGTGPAILIVCAVASLLAWLLYRAARARMARVFRKLEG